MGEDGETGLQMDFLRHWKKNKESFFSSIFHIMKERQFTQILCMNQFNIFHIWLPENNFWMQTEIYYRKRRPMFSVMNEQEELIIQRGESDNSVLQN